MSNQKHVIEIVPPEYQQIREEYEFVNYQCPVCNGQGHFLPCQVGHDEWETTECDYCGGSGRVKAKIEIKWSPDYDSTIYNIE
ncbi:MAG: hypothetical protein PHG27_13070 [Massilibacteroides sp.]|nr:hypothetical protein [Massilibacteroides sp.]MDD4406167.1 hypothetical protein [Parabacteroides sp.]